MVRCDMQNRWYMQRFSRSIAVVGSLIAICCFGVLLTLASSNNNGVSAEVLQCTRACPCIFPSLYASCCCAHSCIQAILAAHGGANTSTTKSNNGTVALRNAHPLRDDSLKHIKLVIDTKLAEAQTNLDAILGEVRAAVTQKLLRADARLRTAEDALLERSRALRQAQGELVRKNNGSCSMAQMAEAIRDGSWDVLAEVGEAHVSESCCHTLCGALAGSMLFMWLVLWVLPWLPTTTGWWARSGSWAQMRASTYTINSARHAPTDNGIYSMTSRCYF